MSFGIRQRNASGSIVFDSSSYAMRMVYRLVIGSISQGMSVAAPGFDSSRGVLFLTVEGNPYAYIPSYTISGSTITFMRNGSSNSIYTLYAVMFS